MTCLFAARAFRDFGDGFVAVLLPAYLLALGHSALQVGIIATVSLLGSALLTMAVGFLGARYDHRQLLLAAASLMVATGVAFSVVHDYALLLVVAAAGTINPSSGSVSIFVPLEHAVLTREVSAAERTRMFARYSLVGALAGAVGALAAATPDVLAPFGLDQLAGIKAMFVLYAILGVAGGLLYARIPRRPPAAVSGTAAALGPSRFIVYKLAALFSLDAFAGGFVVQSLLALWLFERFDMSLAAASVFFFWTGVLSAFSFPVAAWLSRRIGLVNTMVFTHIPSSVCADSGRRRAHAAAGARALADPRRAVADGRADALVIRDGGGHRRGAGRRGEFHRGAAQPGGRGQSRARGGPVRRLVPGLAAHHLRRAEDRLRPAVAGAIPAREAAGGAVTPHIGKICFEGAGKQRTPGDAGVLGDQSSFFGRLVSGPHEPEGGAYAGGCGA